MSRITTETLTTVREVADAPRTIEGVAVPYGMVATDTELGREAFAPGAFAASVQHWMARQDGARMAFRPAHGEKPVGTVLTLNDTPDGVTFRASIAETPAGDDYLGQVRMGLNGVSVEAGLDKNPRRGRDGTVIHRTARLYAIAGSVSPAYDGARIANRDMEDEMPDEPVEVTLSQPEVPGVEMRTAAAVEAASPAAVTLTPAERSARERADAVIGAVRRSPIVISRDAAIYGREAASLPDGSHVDFLSDGFRAWSGDRDAAERQYRYGRAALDLELQIEREALLAYRAGDVLSSEIPGAYPNDYIPTLLTPRILKGRPMGGFYNRFPISDALPKIFPKVTTSTSVAVQSAEGANPAASDFATTAVTATPALYGAVTDVSRQVIDGSSPAAEAMLMQDMFEAYAQASETVIKTAVEAGATGSGQAIVPATPYAGCVANVVAYPIARFKAAQALFAPSVLWGVLAKQPDTSSLKPLLAPVGPTNSTGVIGPGTGGLGADILGASVMHSYASTTNVVVTAASDDYVIFESSITRFTYEQVAGPSAVRIGIWAYLVVGTRKGSLSVTAA